MAPPYWVVGRRGYVLDPDCVLYLVGTSTSYGTTWTKNINTATTMDSLEAAEQVAEFFRNECDSVFIEMVPDDGWLEAPMNAEEASAFAAADDEEGEPM